MLVAVAAGSHVSCSSKSSQMLLGVEQTSCRRLFVSETAASLSSSEVKLRMCSRISSGIDMRLGMLMSGAAAIRERQQIAVTQRISGCKQPVSSETSVEDEMHATPDATTFHISNLSQYTCHDRPY